MSKEKIKHIVKDECGYRHRPAMKYYVGYWGQVENTDAFQDLMGINKRAFWFDSEAEADSFKYKLKECAKKLNLFICTRKEQDPKPYHRLIAYMDLITPCGKRVPYECDFGYCYKEESARHKFFEGSYSCDCNLSDFIDDVTGDFEELDCGNSIKIENFRTEYVRDQK